MHTGYFWLLLLHCLMFEPIPEWVWCEINKSAICSLWNLAFLVGASIGYFLSQLVWRHVTRRLRCKSILNILRKLGIYWRWFGHQAWVCLGVWSICISCHCFSSDIFLNTSFTQELTEAKSCDMLVIVHSKAAGQDMWNFVVASEDKKVAVAERSRNSLAYDRKSSGPRTLPWNTLLENFQGSSMGPSTWITWCRWRVW